MVVLANPVRGFLVSVGLDPEILVEFQYNPTALDDKRSVPYAVLTAPGMLLPVRQYSAGGDRLLSFTVTIDGVFDGPGIGILKDERGGIGPELAKYRAFTYPRTERWPEAAASGFTGLYAGQETVFTAPPVCRFGFGDRVVDCLVTDIAITERLFTLQLDPLRAEVAVSLVELNPCGGPA